MKNKKFLYPLFALMFLVTIYSAVSFVPYDCNISEGGSLMIKGNFLKGAGTTSNTTFYLTNINFIFIMICYLAIKIMRSE